MNRLFTFLVLSALVALAACVPLMREGNLLLLLELLFFEVILVIRKRNYKVDL